MALLQVQLSNSNLDLYILSEQMIPENLELNITIVIYISRNVRYLKDIETIEMTVKAIKKNKISNNNEEISCFSIEDDQFKSIMDMYSLENIRIVVNKIDIINNGVKNNNQLFALNFNLGGDNADSAKKHNIDFSKIILEDSDSNYNIKIYKIQEISSCSNEYKFNLTIDKNIEGINNEIELSFLGSIEKRNFTLKAICTLSSNYNNIMPCQFEEEFGNINFTTMNDYLDYNENELIFISLDESLIFSLYCYEKPPIAAIIFITAIFFFVVIVVIVIIIFINKKGKGEKGYEMPNNSNSNNVLGLSSYGLSK